MKDEPVFYVVDIKEDIDKLIELNINLFSKFKVESKDIDSSNRFLNNLWEIVDEKISPKEKNYCPWAYFPRKFSFNNVTYTYFGSMRTSIGYIHFAISSNKRGTIKDIYLFSFEIDLNAEKWRSVFSEYIKLAKDNLYTDRVFFVQCDLKLLSTSNNLFFERYQSKSFSFDIVGDSQKLKLQLCALNSSDASNKALQKIDRIIDFLAVETNLLYQYNQIEILQDNKKETFEDAVHFQNDFLWQNNFDENKFIDFYPVVNGKLIISTEAISVIEKILNDDYSQEEDFNVFLKGCYHFRNSLMNEIKIQSEFLEIGNEAVLMKTRIDKNMNTILDTSVTGYLSSIETVTSNIDKSSVMKCNSCGQIRFNITSRVNNFMENYLGEGYGVIFKKIYNLRSLYLHTGETCASKYVGPVRPLLDQNTGSGAVDYSGISISINGESRAFNISNIREWVSYSLRNYYKEEILK